MPTTKQCPYCAETILAEAKKCKHCQSPLSDEPVVIEQTSKKYKRQVLIGLCIAATGFVLLFVFASVHLYLLAGIAFLMMPAGLILFLIARIKAWWHHG